MELRNSGILEMRDCRYLRWAFEGHAPPSRAGRWDVRVAGSSEAYGGESAQENEALTPGNTIPWQKFAETTETRRDATRDTLDSGSEFERPQLRLEHKVKLVSPGPKQIGSPDRLAGSFPSTEP